MIKEKQYIVFSGDKRVFFDTEEDLNRHLKTFKNKWEYTIYKKVTK